MTRNLSFHSTFLSTYDHACQYKTAHVAVLLFYPESVFISIMLCLFRIFSPLKDNPTYCLRNNRAGPWLSHYHTFDENCRGSVWFGQAILVTRGRIILGLVGTCKGQVTKNLMVLVWFGLAGVLWQQNVMVWFEAPTRQIYQWTYNVRFFSKSGNLLNKYYLCLQDIKPLHYIVYFVAIQKTMVPFFRKIAKRKFFTKT